MPFTEISVKYSYLFTNYRAEFSKWDYICTDFGTIR